MQQRAGKQAGSALSQPQFGGLREKRAVRSVLEARAGPREQVQKVDDATARLSRVTGPGLPTGGGSNHGAFYAYTSDADFVEKTRIKDGDGDILATAIRSYEEQRDLLASVQTVWRTDEAQADNDEDNLSKYAYTNNALGLRTDVAYSGQAFYSAQVIGQDFGYNDRRELTSSERDDQSVPASWAYQYDPIGNRTQHAEDQGNPVYYCANNRNQYEHTDDASGCATPFLNDLAYDDDGNLTGIDVTGSTADDWTYVWDAENRLVEARKTYPSTSSDKKVTFAYDYRGRRIEKKVYAWVPSPGEWSTTPSPHRRFVWDGWKLLLELNGASSNTVVMRYTWGLDLAGQNGQVNSLEGAGTIGGLLAARWGTTVQTDYVYCYDGNGNVGQVLDLSAEDAGSALAATYEYDPYGNVIRDEGSFCTNNPFRFSTKYFDNESGLGYWGYRYYSPRLGRWISRDPIGERGGLNLYCYVGDRPTTLWDPTGLGWGCTGWVPVPGSTPTGVFLADATRISVSNGISCVWQRSQPFTRSCRAWCWPYPGAWYTENETCKSQTTVLMQTPPAVPGAPGIVLRTFCLTFHLDPYGETVAGAAPPSVAAPTAADCPK